MPDLITDTLKVVTSFFVALVLNKFLSIFRKRQLYLSCWNSLSKTSISDNAIVINASVFNKGKDKEKNVEIKVPNGMSCTVIASDHDATTEGSFVKIDRILANKKISMVLLIEGTRVLDKSTMPSIRSEDTDGKTYLSKDSVPPSAGSFILGGAIFAAFFSYMVISIQTEDNPLAGPLKAYNYMIYNNMYNSGLSINPIGNGLITENYNLRANEYPIEIIDAKIEKNQIMFKFRIINKTSEALKVSGGWRIYKNFQYISEHVDTFDYKDEKKREEEEIRVYKKYNVEFVSDNGYLMEKPKERVEVPANSVGYIIINRKYSPSITYNDLNIEFNFSGGSGEIYQEADMLFTAKNSNISSTILDKK